MKDGMAAAEKVEESEDQAGAAELSGGADDGEFQLTVRKLELPVRPRGVLAE